MAWLDIETALSQCAKELQWMVRAAQEVSEHVDNLTANGVFRTTNLNGISQFGTVHLIEVFNHGSFIIQRITNQSATKMGIRQRASNIWSDWVTFTGNA